MPSTNLFGPYPLTRDIINNIVNGIGTGVYAVGHIDKSRGFVVERVGRSDDDLKARLCQHIGNFSVFKYNLFDTALESYNKECSLYHDFKPRCNKAHPNLPAGEISTCLICGV